MTLSPGAVLGLAAILFAGEVVAAAPDAAKILRRAEEVRNPDLDFAVDFTIRSVSGREKPYAWDASYSMLAHRKERTIILMRSPSSFYGGLVLMAEGRYWMLLPRATRPLELSAAQVLRGDVSSGDLARTDLTRGYGVVLGAEEILDGEPCWRLELARSDPTARYARIVYWVAKKGHLPRRLDYYGNTSRLLRSVGLSDYRSGPLGLRSMRLDIASFGDWEDRTVLTFSNLRRIRPSEVEFRAESMDALRRAALAMRDAGLGSDAPLERILAAIPASSGRAPGP